MSPPDAALFIENRARLCEQLEAGTLAAITSNLASPTNADEFHLYKQNSNLYYLTGIGQNETSVILFPKAQNPSQREILFVQESDPMTVIWEGHKLSIEEARERTGIENVKYASEFEATFRQLAVEAETLAFDTNEHPRLNSAVATGNDALIANAKGWFPLHRLSRLSPLLTEMRMIKSEREVAQIQKAWELTEAGFRRVLGFVRPGVGEWEVEAEYIHEFTRGGSHGFAYSPIVASGANACVLHYTENNQVCQEGDLLLMDVASEWNGWKSDMTRTIPVNGKFTPRQREVYEAVLHVMKKAERLLRPGIAISEYQEKVQRVMGAELVKLALITHEELESEDWLTAVRRYFMHGTSHHLGIDVHDVTAPHCVVEEGMVFTIEPGIYIPEENLGIRLEDNYYIGATENVNLSATVPLEVDEIEALMRS